MREKLSKGDKIYFKSEIKPYQVKALNERYAVCTKKIGKHLFYCIVDFKDNVRSTNNYVFNPYDYSIQTDIDRSLIDLEKGEYELSQRRKCELDIDKILKSQQ